MKNCKIYSLNDPVTNEIRYIGYTSQSLYLRMYDHFKEFRSKSPNCHKNRWIKKLFQNGLRPTIFLIEDGLTKEVAVKREIELIAYHRSIGTRLTNNTIGGDGGVGYKFTEEQKLAQSKRRTGIKMAPCSEERKRKISEANKGRKLSEVQRKKISIATKKRFENLEPRLWLSVLNKGKKMSDGARTKMSEARRIEWAEGRRVGSPCSEERRIKMVAVMKMKANPFATWKPSEEHLDKMRKLHLGNKYAVGKRTAEQRERIRQGVMASKQRKKDGAI